jgi:hypothetical protein
MDVSEGYYILRTRFIAALLLATQRESSGRITEEGSRLVMNHQFNVDLMDREE